MHKTAYHLTGNLSDCEDLLQESFIKYYRKIDDIENISPLEPWLVTVLHNTFIDKYRKATKRNRREVSESDFGELGFEQAINVASISHPNFAQQHADSQVLEGALQTLSPEHRAVIILHDVIGYTIDEMQTIVNAPAGTLKSRIHRARRTLRELLSNETNSHEDSL